MRSNSIIKFDIFNYPEVKLDTKKAKLKVKKPTEETVESLEIGK